MVATVEIEAPPELVWDVTKNLDKGSEMFPTLVKAETLTGSVEEPGSVHTCLHGDGMHLVHYRVAYDPVSRRATDRLTGVPVVGRMLQTWEVQPSPANGNAVLVLLRGASGRRDRRSGTAADDHRHDSRTCPR